MTDTPPTRESDAGWAAEAARQQALLAAIHAGPLAPCTPALVDAWQGTPERIRRGVGAYRANAQALAHRALAAAVPTVEAMVGDDELPALAWAYWQAHPPTRGDIGEWGAALPDWLAAQADLADWPWLADAARLDLALHHAERAADATFDADTLVLLGEHDPGQLFLLPMPGLALVRSAWPIVTMWQAHRALRAGDAQALAPVRVALAEGAAEAALVHRRGWRGEVALMDADDTPFMTRWLAGDDLGAALDAAGPVFDFAAWLPRALAGGWLKGVAVGGDRGASPA